jgi:hypothetical protein
VNDVLSPLQSPDATERRTDVFAPPPAPEKRAPLHRWGISIAVALLLHAVIAVIVFLAWRQSATLTPPGPVIVELAPPSGQPNAQPSEPTFATTGADVGRSDSAERADVDQPFARQAPKPEAAEGTAEPTFANQSRQPVAPTERADENAADVRTASGGGGMPAAPSAGLSGPIDARIAPSFGSRAFDPRARKAPRKLAGSLSPLARQTKQAGGQVSVRRLSALPGSIVINAIGARVQDRVRAAIARANASVSGARNPVGSTGTAGSASANATDSVATNAIGMAVHVHPNNTNPMSGSLGNTTASAGGRIPLAGANGSAGIGGTSINGASINGANMGRPAFRVGAVGGPAKSMVGVLNGTDFHPRHP